MTGDPYYAHRHLLDKGWSVWKRTDPLATDDYYNGDDDECQDTRIASGLSSAVAAVMAERLNGQEDGE